MKYNTRKTGARYEQYAGAYLEEHGYKVLQYNYRCKKGEIDIVAKDGEYLVFCEVKYRAGVSGGSPAEAVDLRKQKKISGSAMYYLMENHLTDVPCRFDVVAIQGREITLIKNAFEYIGG